MTILKRLDIYWLHANPSVKEKIQVYDSIIRSKLLYGLESAPMNESTKHELDIFQLKGLRKILGIKTTFVDRAQDNRTIYKKAQNHIKNETAENKATRHQRKTKNVHSHFSTTTANRASLRFCLI